MKTIQEILEMFPSTTQEDWKQYPKGKGWVQVTAIVDASCVIEGIVSGNARVSGNAWVSGNAQVSGNARVSGNAWVSSDARVSGDARVFGNAWVAGDARVFGNAWETSPLYVQGSVHAATNYKHGYIAIGCEVHTFAEWQAKFETIGQKNGYTVEQIAEYKAIIDLFVKIGK